MNINFLLEFIKDLFLAIFISGYVIDKFEKKSSIREVYIKMRLKYINMANEIFYLYDDLICFLNDPHNSELNNQKILKEFNDKIYELRDKLRKFILFYYNNQKVLYLSDENYIVLKSMIETLSTNDTNKVTECLKNFQKNIRNINSDIYENIGIKKNSKIQ